MEDIRTIKVNDNEDIDIIEVNDNENIFPIALKTLLKGEKGEAAKEYMTYIDLSTDMENPTELFEYVDKGGTYVAKNDGFLGLGGETFTALHKGQFFKIFNFKDLASNVGIELPDEENLIIMTIPSVEGVDYTLMKYGLDDWQDAITINSANINDYVNIDTSNLVNKNSINGNYGIFMVNNYLAIMGASTAEINSGSTNYKPITPYNLDYALQQKGVKYFATKEDFQTLKDENDKVLSQIEAVLDTVVSV